MPHAPLQSISGCSNIHTVALGMLAAVPDSPMGSWRCRFDSRGPALNAALGSVRRADLEEGVPVKMDGYETLELSYPMEGVLLIRLNRPEVRTR